MSLEAEGDKYKVERIRQTEVEDIFSITNKETDEVTYEHFPRSMENDAENVLSYYE